MQDIQRREASVLKPLPAPEALGFGKYFSDHWFFSKYAESRGWYESRLEPYGPMLIDPAASVLHYGQSLFEGMKAFRQRGGQIAVFRPGFNYRRLAQGCDRMCLIAPPKELFMAGLKELILLDSRWVPEQEHCALYIRPTLIGTEGFLGVRPSKEILFYILLSPVGSYYSTGTAPVKIYVEDKVMRAAPGGMGATKAGANYAASLRSALEAKAKGYAQVLWLEADHESIQEVGTMNVFFVFKNEIVTPALNGNILAGGVRESVIQLLKHMGRPIVERPLTIGEALTRLQKGDFVEAFGTGTAAVVSPIGELHYRGESFILNRGEAGPLSLDLLRLITGIQRGTEKDLFRWMVSVDDLAN
jgi:branched-chain amino acid aminotransferase